MGNKSKCNGVKKAKSEKWVKGVGRGGNRGQMPPRFGGLRAPTVTRHAIHRAWASSELGTFRRRQPAIKKNADGSVTIS